MVKKLYFHNLDCITFLSLILTILVNDAKASAVKKKATLDVETSQLSNNDLTAIN